MAVPAVRSLHRWTVAFLGAVCAFAFLTATADAYRFGEPGARSDGPERTVFDWSTMACEPNHIPDLPVRAFRDSSERVQLILPHHTTRRMVGNTLDTVANQCAPLMTSDFDPNPASWNYMEWVASVYTLDGTKIHALAHEEYHGWDFAGMCATQKAYDPKCWYNALTLASSTDTGASYRQPAAPAQHVASSPYQYERDTGPYGTFEPSNIVTKGGYYHVMVKVEAHGAQKAGSCLLRTQNLDDADSWRAWDGIGFNVRFIDPYIETTAPPENHVCEPVSPTRIGTTSQSVTWNSYFKQWVLLAARTGREDAGVFTDGIWYSTSPDLITWTPAKLLMEAQIPWTYKCGDENPVIYPALIDPDSPSRNFESTDQDANLYFTRMNYSSCNQTLDRDLIKIPVRFSNQVPGGPTASFTASPNPAATGQNVTFDASGSRDANGSIARYRWDLDGDGSFDVESGTNPRTSRSYDAPGVVAVRLRVVDNEGNATDETRKVVIETRSKKPRR